LRHGRWYGYELITVEHYLDGGLSVLRDKDNGPISRYKGFEQTGATGSKGDSIAK